MTLVDTQATIDRAARASETVWERACAVDELEEAFGEAVLVGSKQIALFLVSPTEIYAVSNTDPATAAPVIARGIVGSCGERPTVASPLHKEVYDLGTGECIATPGLLLETFRTRIIGGFIEIEIMA
jgi:nitrite reductase (NADH) small subunit